MSAANDHGRSRVLESLRNELVGPEPLGEPLDLTSQVSFDSWRASNGPWYDAATGEEILTRDGPTKRYGVGVLYGPDQELIDAVIESTEEDTQAPPPPPDPADTVEVASSAAETLARGGGSADDDDFDLTAANQYRPSAMAVSFLAQLAHGSRVVATADCGRYEGFDVTIEGKPRKWWVRRSVHIGASWTAEALSQPDRPHRAAPASPESTGLGPIQAGFEAYARPRNDGSVLVTVVLRNSTHSISPTSSSLFQVGFQVEVEGDGRVVPYPDHRSEQMVAHDQEEQSLRLLYRNSPTFGIGHGCAAIWEADWGQMTVDRLRAECLPATETPSITPDIRLEDGTVLSASMAALGGLDPEDNGFEACQRIIEEYENWIDRRRSDLTKLTEADLPAGERHLDECVRIAQRMRSGLDWLRTDPVAREAFRLANRAVLFQQLRSSLKARTTRITKGGIITDDPHPSPNWRSQSSRGDWRPFQIGFLLAAARSSVLEDDPHRSEVDLIFFPTGGGKTEAYLGLAAFALFYQRFTDRDHPGVGVLMRYTLRLLTAQQFLRASALICAMEEIRRNHTELAGGRPFSIGIWVGMSATPNSRNDARSKLKDLNRTLGARNPFLVLQCPWCAAAMGPASTDGKVQRESGVHKSMGRTVGYIEREGSVRFRCPDSKCAYSRGLPIYVVDEDVYDLTPSLVIGTIDKFAQLAWNPTARRLFGIQPDGSRGWTPPNLIIQDELHLISGPLGSMAGLYETLIEELSTDHRGSPARVPKVVCSTATIRQFQRQIKDLYGRDRSALFPPFGLDASDSFFARYARNDDTGKMEQGRLYVGVYAPGLGSMQTAQVRTFSALLQAAKELPVDQADPWWTLMCFFNSLRELGTSVSLLQSDIPDYLKAMRNRRGTAASDLRYLNVFKELTGRLREDEVPAAIQDLERATDDKWPVDVCLASSMIEVGIDITRLSLMAVAGQPKTTSQYIQVTGRVGRLWRERPGLVVTIYGASKPRDRSHFERFQTYHSNLYAQVEPVSVTPFAPPVVRRAAHAILAGYVRQLGAESIQPWPVPESLTNQARALLEDRAARVDRGELAGLKDLLEQRLYEWRAWERQDWDAKWTSGIDPAPLLRAPGRWYPEAVERVSWPTPTSLRDVDAECEARITMHYAHPPGANP